MFHIFVFLYQIQILLILVCIYIAITDIKVELRIFLIIILWNPLMSLLQTFTLPHQLLLISQISCLSPNITYSIPQQHAQHQQEQDIRDNIFEVNPHKRPN